jgi:hypothetical protein
VQRIVSEASRKPRCVLPQSPRKTDALGKLKNQNASTAPASIANSIIMYHSRARSEISPSTRQMITATPLVSPFMLSRKLKLFVSSTTQKIVSGHASSGGRNSLR